jgi:hypothetical protein
MTLAWKTIGDDILLQEGTQTYNFEAAGTIKAGMAVKPYGTMTVSGCISKDSTGFVGIAEYDITKGKFIGIHGPGNIVRCRVSGAVTVGDGLQTASDTEMGYLAHRTAAAGAKVGIALETKTADTTNGSVCRVLLV